MLSERFRHPDDLKDVEVACRDIAFHGNNVGMIVERPGRVMSVTIPIQYAHLVVIVHGKQSVTMPVWLAKNKELLDDNEPLPVTQVFP